MTSYPVISILFEVYLVFCIRIKFILLNFKTFVRWIIFFYEFNNIIHLARELIGKQTILLYLTRLETLHATNAILNSCRFCFIEHEKEEITQNRQEFQKSNKAQEMREKLNNSKSSHLNRTQYLLYLRIFIENLRRWLAANFRKKITFYAFNLLDMETKRPTSSHKLRAGINQREL